MFEDLRTEKFDNKMNKKMNDISQTSPLWTKLGVLLTLNGVVLTLTRDPPAVKI